MTRKEHLEWCKQRAMEYVDAGDLTNAITSMLSDLRKHPETETHIGGELGAMLLIGGHMKDTQSVTQWIQGFN